MGLGARKERLDDLVDLCERGMLTTERVDALLECYSEALSASSGAITQVFGFGRWARAHRVPLPWIEFHQAHAKHDHSPEILLPHASGHSYSVMGSVRDGVTPEDNPLPPALATFGLGDACISTIHNPFGSRLFMVFYRPPGAPDFSRVESNVIRMMEPHLAKAFAMRSALAAIHSDGPANDAEARRAAKAHAWLVDGDFDWSPSSLPLFERTLGVGRRKLPDLAALLRSEVESAEREGRGRTFRIGGLRVDFATSLRDGNDETLLLFYDAGARRPPLNAAVKLLSPQQRRIAACLVRGDTLGEIATELSIGVETVRTHVRVIARRFGTSTRAELVLRLCDA